MYAMSTWALSTMVIAKLKTSFDGGFHFDPVPWIGLVLIALALLMLIEAVIIIAGTFGGGARSGPRPSPVGAEAA
jgi:hypothetical protein